MKSAVAQYVYLHIDVNKDTANRGAWDKLYPSDQNGIPLVQVVASDGRKVYDKSGAVGPDELRKLLGQTGRILAPAILAKIKKAHEAAAKALEEGQIAKAVGLIQPVLGSRGNGEVVTAAEEFGKKLVDQFQTDAKDAEEKLASEETALEGALIALRISRDYGKLKAVTDDMKKLNLLKNHKDHKAAFEQARPLDAAGILAANSKSKAAAIKAYQAVVKKFPDSAASKFAEAKIAELEGGEAEPDKPVKAKPAKNTKDAPAKEESTEEAAGE